VIDAGGLNHGLTSLFNRDIAYLASRRLSAAPMLDEAFAKGQSYHMGTLCQGCWLDAGVNSEGAWSRFNQLEKDNAIWYGSLAFGGSVKPLWSSRKP
jgi:hypothetical protein